MLRRADVLASADAGLKPASPGEALLRAVTGCGIRHLSGVQISQDEEALVNAASVGAHGPEGDAPREVTMFTAHKRAGTTAAK